VVTGEGSVSVTWAITAPPINRPLFGALRTGNDAQSSIVTNSTIGDNAIFEIASSNIMSWEFFFFSLLIVCSFVCLHVAWAFLYCFVLVFVACVCCIIALTIAVFTSLPCFHSGCAHHLHDCYAHHYHTTIVALRVNYHTLTILSCSPSGCCAHNCHATFHHLLCSRSSCHAHKQCTLSPADFHLHHHFPKLLPTTCASMQCLWACIASTL